MIMSSHQTFSGKFKHLTDQPNLVNEMFYTMPGQYSILIVSTVKPIVTTTYHVFISSGLPTEHFVETRFVQHIHVMIKPQSLS